MRLFLGCLIAVVTSAMGGAAEEDLSSAAGTDAAAGEDVESSADDRAVRRGAVRRDARRTAVEAILSSPLPADAYRRGGRCVSVRSFRHIEVLDDATIVFVGRGRGSWVARTKRHCPGLRPGLMIRIDGWRACAGTPFQGVILSGSVVPVTAPCTIGSVHEVDRDELDALRIALTAKARTRTLSETYRNAARQ